MKLIKSIIASSLVFLATSAFAASPVVKSVVAADSADSKAVRMWSSVCVGNLAVEAPVAAQYAYVTGAEGEEIQWTDHSFEQNTLWIFSQRYPNGVEPLQFKVKFMNADGEAGQELSYDLTQTETRFRQGNCNSLENYLFEQTDGEVPTLDLIRVEE